MPPNAVIGDGVPPSLRNVRQVESCDHYGKHNESERDDRYGSLTEEALAIDTRAAPAETWREVPRCSSERRLSLESIAAEKGATVVPSELKACVRLSRLEAVRAGPSTAT